MSKRNVKRSLGSVKTLTPMGYLVVSMLRGKPLPLGSQVYYRDEHGVYRKLGALIDIIGNVEKPYAVVKITDKDVIDILSEGFEVLYELPVRRSRRGARR